MKPKIWLRSAKRTWLELAADDMGTLDISSIAKRTDLRPETVLFGELGAPEGITIAEVRAECGSTAGESKESAVLVDGDAAAHTEEGGPALKRARIEDPSLQSFVQSAARHYRQWEQAEKAGEKAGVGKEGHKNFLAVSGDPFGSFPEGFLIWIRKCYKDLKEILAKAKASQRFTLLGTSGIGKSLFTVFWICYRAALKEKVVWKFANGSCYLLDFSEEGSLSENAKVAKAYGPFSETDCELRVVYDDPAAWLIIDGRQRGNLNYRCHILLACSAGKDYYKEFSKNLKVSIRYIPVWAKEEIIEFLDDFEDAKADYSHMQVPVREKAMDNFRMLGGVPRYVLCGEKTEERLAQLAEALGYLGQETCLKFFSGLSGEDCLVHINCSDGVYDTFVFDFASSYVRDEFGNRFPKLSKCEVVRFLSVYANNSLAGNIYGYIYELVAHELMQRGGVFERKKVGFEGKRLEVVVEDKLELTDQMKVVRFTKVEELALMPNTYYKPSIANFESIDALVYPNTLLQFFSSRRGKHGYKVNGLNNLHEQLKLPKYNLCSCVPVEKYEITGFQDWLTAEKTKYRKGDKVLDLMDQFVVCVDYKKYSA